MQCCPHHGDHRVIQYSSIILKRLYLVLSFVFMSIDIQLILITGCLFVIISVLVICAKVGSVIVEGSTYKSKTNLGH